MALQTRSLQGRDKLASYLWAGEQKLTNLLAVSLGTTIGILVGLFHAVKLLAPHFKSIAGVKRLYYGDPSLAASFNRTYLKDTYTSAKLRSTGGSPILSSEPAGKTSKTGVPILENGDETKKSQGAKTREKIGTDVTPPAADKHSHIDSSLYKDSSFEDSTPKSGTTTTSLKDARGTEVSTPKSGAMTPVETEGDTETEDDVGSEYTGTTISQPTTPRNSVLAPQDTGSEGKKKRKHRVSKGIKKTFGKLADAFSPGHTSTKP